ncbi:nuclear transport factor 2 family protein [Mycolicibacterium confluentis]|nr:nuclear transport factor 2 family protein [Mycolicibacterium confluentis]
MRCLYNRAQASNSSAIRASTNRDRTCSSSGVTATVFTRDELAAAFQTFEQDVAEAARTQDWDAWVEHYTDDVLYIEHAAGTMRGRDEVRTWIRRTMSVFPGSYMTAFPSLWTVYDEATGRVICELDNPMRDPGDGTIISATNISIVTYAGDGKWSRQEDVYNPLRFVAAASKWCRKAQELGTLDDEAAAWYEKFGARR